MEVSFHFILPVFGYLQGASLVSGVSHDQRLTPPQQVRERGSPLKGRPGEPRGKQRETAAASPPGTPPPTQSSTPGAQEKQEPLNAKSAGSQKVPSPTVTTVRLLDP